MAYVVATRDDFGVFLRFFMPTDELLRLRAMRAAEPGMGPYRVNSVLFIAVSNSVYLFEMVVAFLLLFRRTTVYAAVAAIFFVLAIECGAREFFFGSLIINLFLFYLPGPCIKRLFPLFALLFVYLVAASFKLVPMFSYSV